MKGKVEKPENVRKAEEAKAGGKKLTDEKILAMVPGAHKKGAVLAEFLSKLDLPDTAYYRRVLRLALNRAMDAGTVRKVRMEGDFGKCKGAPPFVYRKSK